MSCSSRNRRGILLTCDACDHVIHNATFPDARCCYHQSIAQSSLLRDSSTRTQHCASILFRDSNIDRSLQPVACPHHASFHLICCFTYAVPPSQLIVSTKHAAIDAKIVIPSIHDAISPFPRAISILHTPRICFTFFA